MYASTPMIHLPPKDNLLQLAMDSAPGLEFRAATTQAETFYPPHQHCWAEFVCSFTGSIEVEVGDDYFVAPPQFGIWLPPAVEHTGFSRQAACHGSLYIHPLLIEALPSHPCMLLLEPLTRALLEHLRLGPANDSEAHQRLLQVLLDQLAVAEVQGSYLPVSEDALLAPLLSQLMNNPSDGRSAAELAASLHVSERTLIRRFQAGLGMPLRQWRQRLRVIKAYEMLEAGEAVENIALDLGYSSASAFIVMFRQQTGMTPEQWRQR
ncbi:helix-turn-helix domain-containing protein [Oceanobacter mangrovi]|uniref:helix-turn-helix domain-containing protein n=1 Tax=Oceanobacter mangrovi TaxID=2862510 RepID=UPI001C8ECF2B|nr:helix-turn-helix transcriptional regulator [Oceanobacter mangrovi]